ncbi:class I SAM-dependent methyltransferase [Luminiphilus sp.]|nr:class I SAM-dependent methyltransferase [Luminiphilus sp.]
MKVLYEQRGLPVLQNRCYDTPEQAVKCATGHVTLVENQQTGLIYNAQFDSDLVTYDEKYDNEQSLSPSFRQHLSQVAEIVTKTLGKDSLIEVGCGKGFFLEFLLARGVDVTGFDPTYTGDNPRIINTLFEPEIISKPAKGLVLRHVLEHVPDPVHFLSSLRDANGGEGKIYIEVPCFDWILQRGAWFDIFYEHVNYFRLSDLEGMFSQVERAGRFFGGQYLYIVAELSSLREPIFQPALSVEFPSNFYEGIEIENQRHPERLRYPRVAWGAASKGVIFTLFCQRQGLSLDAAIDVNPAKQGKFMPVTGVPVISPETAASDLPAETLVYVMNSNYLSEIRRMSGNKFNYVGID